MYMHMYIWLRGGTRRSQNRWFLRVHDKGMGTSLCCPTRAMVDVSVDREKQVLGSGVPGVARFTRNLSRGIPRELYRDNPWNHILWEGGVGDSLGLLARQHSLEKFCGGSSGNPQQILKTSQASPPSHPPISCARQATCFHGKAV